MKFNELAPLRQLVCLAVLSGMIPVPEGMQIADYVGSVTRLYIANEPISENYYIRNREVPTQAVTQNITFSNYKWQMEDTPSIRFSARSQIKDASEVTPSELGDRLSLTTDLILEGTVPEMLERLYNIIKSTKICFHPDTIEWRLNVISKLMEAYEEAQALDSDTVRALAGSNAANKLIDSIAYRVLQPGLITTSVGLISINHNDDVHRTGDRVQDIMYFPDIETYKVNNYMSKIALIIDTSQRTKVIAKVKEFSDVFNDDNGQAYTVTTTPICTVDIPKLMTESGELANNTDDIEKWWNIILDEIIASATVKNFGDKLDTLFNALCVATAININTYPEPDF